MKSPPEQIRDDEARENDRATSSRKHARKKTKRRREGRSRQAPEGRRLGAPGLALAANVALRLCLVTPFAWSQPHDVNEHVAGRRRASCARSATRSPCSRPRTARADLAAGRRALLDGADAEVIALGPAVPDLAPEPDRRPGRRARANLVARARARAIRRRPRLRAGPAEPLVPRAARRAARSTVATLLLAGAARLPARARRSASGCSARIDALVATSPETAAAAARALPRRLPRSSREGVDTELFRPGREAAADRARVAADRAAARARACCARCDELPGWELVLLRTKPLAGRPTIPRALRGRVHVAHGARRRSAGAAARTRRRSSSPRSTGLARVALEAAAAGAAIAVAAGRARAAGARRAPRSRGSPRTTTLRERKLGDEARAERRGPELRRRRRASSTSSTAALGAAPARRAATATRSPTAPGSSPTCTCTRRWSHDCSIDRSRTCSTTPRRSGSARSRSPTTTSSAARSRRSSSRATAT